MTEKLENFKIGDLVKEPHLQRVLKIKGFTPHNVYFNIVDYKGKGPNVVKTGKGYLDSCRLLTRLERIVNEV